MDELMTLNQEGTLNTYWDDFNFLLEKVRVLENIEEYYATYLFICGLNREIGGSIMGYHNCGAGLKLEHAFILAKEQEGKPKWNSIVWKQGRYIENVPASCLMNSEVQGTIVNVTAEGSLIEKQDQESIGKVSREPSYMMCEEGSVAKIPNESAGINPYTKNCIVCVNKEFFDFNETVKKLRRGETAMVNQDMLETVKELELVQGIQNELVLNRYTCLLLNSELMGDKKFKRNLESKRSINKKMILFSIDRGGYHVQGELNLVQLREIEKEKGLRKTWKKRKKRVTFSSVEIILTKERTTDVIVAVISFSEATATFHGMATLKLVRFRKKGSSNFQVWMVLCTLMWRFERIKLRLKKGRKLETVQNWKLSWCCNNLDLSEYFCKKIEYIVIVENANWKLLMEFLRSRIFKGDGIHRVTKGIYELYEWYYGIFDIGKRVVECTLNISQDIRKFMGCMNVLCYRCLFHLQTYCGHCYSFPKPRDCWLAILGIHKYITKGLNNGMLVLNCKWAAFIITLWATLVVNNWRQFVIFDIDWYLLIWWNLVYKVMYICSSFGVTGLPFSNLSCYGYYGCCYSLKCVRGLLFIRATSMNSTVIWFNKLAVQRIGYLLLFKRKSSLDRFTRPGDTVQFRWVV